MSFLVRSINTLSPIRRLRFRETERSCGRREPKTQFRAARSRNESARAVSGGGAKLLLVYLGDAGDKVEADATKRYSVAFCTSTAAGYRLAVGCERFK